MAGQGQLQIQYDEIDDTFRAFQPVTVPDSQQDSPLASEEAALDVGANNLIACTTTTGQQYLYEGRDLFDHFRETTDEIARLQSKLREGRYSSNRIRQLYQKRTRRRDHAQEAPARDLMERLYTDGVETVYVGDLTDVLSTHWCAEVNAKTHQFWAFRAFIDRLLYAAEEYGIRVEVQSEANTTRTCPVCGEREDTDRDGDVFRCPCGHEAHADLCASRTFLEQQTCELEGGSMARPVRLTWDDHNWSETPHSPEGKSQRGAHKPEYRQRESCLRGYGIANIPPEESSRFSAGRTSNIVRSGLHRGVVFTWPVRYARMAACATPLGRVLTCRDESSR